MMHRKWMIVGILTILFLGAGLVPANASLPEGVEPGAWAKVQAHLQAQGVRPAAAKNRTDLPTEVAKLLPTPDMVGDWTEFGRVVAIDGDTMVVGTLDGDIGGDEPGSVYVFERNEGGVNAWGQVAELKISEGQDECRLGSPIAISGDTIVVGGDFVSGYCGSSGFVFERNEGGPNGWGQVAKLEDRSSYYPDLASSVAIDGDTIVVGANYDGHYWSGAWAFVFERNAGGANAWGQVALLDDSGENRTYGVLMSVSISGTTIVIGANNWLYDPSGTAYVYERDFGGAGAWGEVTMLFPSDGANGDGFGSSVAINGDTIVVGANQDDDNGPNSGSVYVFDRNQGGVGAWGECGKIVPPDGRRYAYFGISVSLFGQTIVVGANYDDGAGSAYIFRRNQGGNDSWGLVAKILDSSGITYDRFGSSVSVAGTTVVVGAPGDGDNGEDSGTAFVFDRDEGGTDAWGEVAKRVAPGTSTARGDLFGSSVAAESDTVVVGAPGDDDNGSDFGAVYVFDRNEGGVGVWGRVAKVLASGGRRDDEFGHAVAISGDIVVVGAYTDSENGWRSGAVYVFERNEGGMNAWGQVAKLKAVGGENLEGFGYSVSLSGNTLVVGASSSSVFGSVYLFERDEGGADAWGQVTKLSAPDWPGTSSFGPSVSVSGDTFVVRVRGNDDRDTAFVFDRNKGGRNAWGRVATLMISDDECGYWRGCPVALSGDSVAIGGSCVDEVGLVYLFERNEGGVDAWGQVAKLVDPDPPRLPEFGGLVSISGDTLVVGALNGGSTYLFERNQGGPKAWGLVAKLLASDGTGGGQFGRSFSINGDSIVVGADKKDDNGYNSGGAYVFDLASPTPGDCIPIYVAATASYPNNNPPWASDLGINNNSDEELTYKMQFLPRGEDNTDVAFSEDMTLGGNTSVSYVDVWDTYSGEGAGAINVCVSDADAASVTSRIYTTTDQGTFGQNFVGKVGAASSIVTGEKVRLGFLAQNPDFRTNVGFMNAGADAITVNAEFFSADGTSLGTSSIDLPPFSNNQWNRAFMNQVGITGIAPGAFVDVWSDTTDASFLTYASVIDNVSDDPTTIWPFNNTQIVGGDGLDCTPIWLAAAASFPNNNTPWASDLDITNLDAEALRYKFQFLPRGEDNAAVAFSDLFTLGGNQAVVYSDIWNELAGGQGAGTINVCLDNADNAGVVSRIYSTAANGTYGQSFDGMRGAAPTKVANGEKVRLAYLFQNDAYRTNIGFMNAGPNEISITAEFFDSQGNSLGMKGDQLAPYSNTQWNAAYTKPPINADGIEAGYVEVWTDTEDGNFLTYASVIDNGTGDPTTIWPN